MALRSIVYAAAAMSKANLSCLALGAGNGNEMSQNDVAAAHSETCSWVGNYNIHSFLRRVWQRSGCVHGVSGKSSDYDETLCERRAKVQGEFMLPRGLQPCSAVATKYAQGIRLTTFRTRFNVSWDLSDALVMFASVHAETRHNSAQGGPG